MRVCSCATCSASIWPLNTKTTSCPLGDLWIFSICPLKVIACNVQIRNSILWAPRLRICLCYSGGQAHALLKSNRSANRKLLNNKGNRETAELRTFANLRSSATTHSTHYGEIEAS